MQSGEVSICQPDCSMTTQAQAQGRGVDHSLLAMGKACSAACLPSRLNSMQHCSAVSMSHKGRGKASIAALFGMHECCPDSNMGTAEALHDGHEVHGAPNTGTGLQAFSGILFAAHTNPSLRETVLLSALLLVLRVNEFRVRQRASDTCSTLTHLRSDV